MAKIEIIIEDLPDGKIKIVSTPSFEDMCKIDLSGFMDLSPAHGMAFALLNRAREVSKDNSPTNLIHIPKIKL